MSAMCSNKLERAHFIQQMIDRERYYVTSHVTSIKFKVKLSIVGSFHTWFVNGILCIANGSTMHDAYASFYHNIYAVLPRTVPNVSNKRDANTAFDFKIISP